MDLTPEEQFKAALAEHIGCQKPHCLIRRADKEMLSLRSFDMRYARVVNALAATSPEGDPVRRYRDKAALYAIGSPGMEVVRSICYRPDGAPIIDGKFNMWTDPGIEELGGDPKIFWKHLNYLIPNQAERRALIAWLAWIVQHPTNKIQWAILIVGKGGTGKSWLGYVMERIFGKGNVVLIAEDDAVTGTFNGFSENKRFIFLHETPPDMMETLLQKLRGLITQDEVHINRKGIERYAAENFANLMGIANEPVKIDLTNRRWCIINAADDPMGVDDNGRPTPEHKAYYDRLWSVVPKDKAIITDELRRIYTYLKNLPIDRMVAEGKFDPLTAPMTGAKADAAGVTAENVLGKIIEKRANREGPFRFDLLTQEEVRKACGGSAGHALARDMEEAGLRKLKLPNGRDAQPRIKNIGRPRLWAYGKTVADKYKGMGVTELGEAYVKQRNGDPALLALAKDADAEAAGDFA